MTLVVVVIAAIPFLIVAWLVAAIRQVLFLKMARRRPKRSPRIFLLSPANCSGRRAQLVLSPNAQFTVARDLRSRERRHDRRPLQLRQRSVLSGQARVCERGLRIPRIQPIP